MKMSKKVVLISTGALFLVAATIAVCFFLFYQQAAETSLTFEDNATAGIMPGIDIAERQKDLQNILDKNMIAFSINTTPVFLNGMAEGNLLIENPENNAKLIKVSIIINGTSEEVYSSNFIKPGTYIESAKLDKVLEKGTYDATAYFSAYEEETAKYIGQTGAGITLLVEN